MFAIEGKTLTKGKVYWQGWTGDCCAGRPKWVTKFTQKCLFAKRLSVEKLLDGRGSTYFVKALITNGERGEAVTEITIKEYDIAQALGQAQKRTSAARPEGSRKLTFG